MADAYWDVVYRAVADFGDVIAQAAAVKAALEDMGSTARVQSDGAAAAALRAAEGYKQDVSAVRGLSDTMRQAVPGADQYNQRVLWAGASSEQQHQSNLQRESDLTNLLWRARQRGFSTPQADYAWRQREIQQGIDWAKAQQRGYASFDQYLNALQRERQAMNDYNTTLAARQQLEQDATQSALSHINANEGSHKSIGELTVSANALNDALNDLPDTVTVDAEFDDSDALRDQAAYMAALHAIPDTVETHARIVVPNVTDTIGVPRSPDDLSADRIMSGASLAAMSAAMAAMHGYGDEADDTAAKLELLSRAEDAAGVRALTLAAQVRAAKRELNDAGDGGSGMVAHTSGGGRGFWGLLTTKIPLFGGASEIAGWHLLLDLAIEFAAVAVPAAMVAAARLGAYAAATAQTYIQVFDRFRAQYNVTSATQTNITPFALAPSSRTPGLLQQYGVAPTASGAAAQQGQINTTKLQELASVMRPEVFQQLGDVLDILNQRSTVFDQLALSTGSALDKFAAKMTLAATQGRGFGTFLQTGTKDLSMFGHMAEAMGALFMEFVKATQITHIAEDIFGGLTATLHGLAVVLGAIGPYGLAAGVALHAIFVYGGLATTAAKNLAGWVVQLGGSIPILSDKAYGAAKALGATNEELQAMAAKSPAVKAVAADSEASAQQLASLSVAADRTGRSLEDMVPTTMRSTFEDLTKDFGNAGTQAVALGIAAGEKDAPALAKMGEAAEEAAGSGGALSKVMASLPSALSNVWVWVGLATVAIGIFTFKMITSQDAAQKWVSNLNSALASSTVTAGFKGVLGALTEVDTKLLSTDQTLSKLGDAGAFRNLSPQFVSLQESARNATTATGGIDAAAEKSGSAMRGAAGDAGQLGAQLHTVASGGSEAMGQLLGIPAATARAASSTQQFASAQSSSADAATRAANATGRFSAAQRQSLSSQSEAYVQAQRDSQTYSAEQQKLADQTNLLLYRGGKISSMFGVNLNQAFGLATMAGLKFSDMTSTQKNQLALIELQIQSTVNGYKAMGQVQGQLGSDINVVTYAQSAQLKNMQQLNQAWTTYLGNVEAPEGTFITLAGGIDAMDKAGKAAGASLTGLGASSLTLRGDFQTAFQNAESYVQALATAGVHTVGPIKQLEAALIPMGKNSAATRADLVALAQQGDPAITSFQKLTTWVGHTSGSLHGLDKDASSATTAERDLAKQSETLATSLSNDLQNTISNLVYSSSDLPKQMEAWAQSIKGVGGSAQQTAAQRQQLLTSIEQVTGETKNEAIGTLNSLSKGILTTGQAADVSHAGRQQLLNDIINFGVPTNKAINDFDQLNQSVVDNGAKSNATHQARQQLIQDLEKAGLTSRQATTFVDGLIKSLSNVHGVNATVDVHGKGSWTVTQETDVGSAKSGLATALAGRRADGGFMGPATGGATADDKIIAVSGGEYVQRAAAVSQYGVGAMDAVNSGRARISYADGGPVSVSGTDTGTPAQVGSWTDQEYTKTVRAIETDVGDALVNSIKQAQQKAEQAMVSGHFGGGSASPGLLTFARYLMSHGASAVAAAGAAGAVAGESGGNPEALQAGGGGGTGLLQWTPGSSAFPIQPIVTGNPGRDMAVQLIDALAYINSRGGIGALNSAGAHGGLEGAALEMSRMEAPAVLGSDIQIGAAEAVFAQLSGGRGARANAQVPHQAPGHAAGGLVGGFKDGGPAGWLPKLSKGHVGQYTSSETQFGRAWNAFVGTEDLEAKSFWDLMSAHEIRRPHPHHHGVIEQRNRMFKDFASLRGKYDTFTGKDPDQWTDWWFTNLKDSIRKLLQAEENAGALHSVAPGRMGHLRSETRDLLGSTKWLEDSWKTLMKSKPGHAAIPGRVHGISTGSPVATLINPGGGMGLVRSLLPNAPGAGTADDPGMMGLAGGGLASVAGTFGSMGGLAGTNVSLANAPAGGRYAAGGQVDTPRSLGAAGQQGMGERIGLQIQGGLNIYNPAPEPASDSITRSTQKAAFMAGRDLA